VLASWGTNVAFDSARSMEGYQCMRVMLFILVFYSHAIGRSEDLRVGVWGGKRLSI
jgi:hypothetical protein